MQLPFYRRLTEEDLSSAPKGAWKGKLLYAINKFIQQIYTGLNNNLTPEQNCIAQTKNFILTGSSTPENNIYTFAANYAYNPIIMDQWVTGLNGTGTVFIVAPYVTAIYNNGQIEVLGISGLTDNVQYSVTLRIWWPAVVN